MRKCHEFFNNTSKPTGLEHMMLKLTTPRHALLQDRQGRTFADVPSDSEHPFDTVIDLFIGGDGQRPIHDSGTDHERIPVAEVVRKSGAHLPIDYYLPSEYPHGTKRSRQAMGVVTHLGMEHHGWKRTGTKSPIWAFEHRWPHMRDHAEGRNHRLPSN